MLTLLECAVAIGATILTCMFAGRIAAVTLTALTAATAALVMPPFMSWQVESETDIMAIFFQTAVGLIVVYRWPAKIRQHAEIKSRSTEQHRIAVSEDQAAQVLDDVLRMAVSHSKIERVSIHSASKPASDEITVVAEYDSDPSLPRVRLLGRTDRQRTFHAKTWPQNCSATYFDNGHEHIYLISISR